VSANQAMHAIATMCRVLEVSTSGYYAWRQRRRSLRACADADLSLRIGVIHQRSRTTYGGRRGSTPNLKQRALRWDANG
jgi:putative transposase